MGKLNPNKFFLFRHRFKLGYLLLGLIFTCLLFFLPLITPNGLSNDEFNFTTKTFELNRHTIFREVIVDLPYHLLQKGIFKIFGVSPYTIMLPSVIIGAITCILIILLLNRWFKNNTAIMASIITVLSSSFLFISGSGTALIMILFWTTLLLWLGSKVQGENKPKTSWCFLFGIFMCLSIFTPYMLYLDFFILIYVFVHPHLRFTLKNLPKIPLAIFSLMVISAIAILIMRGLKHPEIFTELLLMPNFSLTNYFHNLGNAVRVAITWNGLVESTFLAPLYGLPAITLAIIGFISTFKGFFASRNSMAFLLTIFTLLISGLNSQMIILFILPLAILVAHGMKYILHKWSSIFPYNPYAKVIGVLPIGLFMLTVIISDLNHFVYGYRYSAPVANQFTNDIKLLDRYYKNNLLYLPENQENRNFYVHLANSHTIFNKTPKYQYISNLSENTKKHNIISFEKITDTEHYELEYIVTNEKSQNADRLYLYKSK